MKNKNPLTDKQRDLINKYLLRGDNHIRYCIHSVVHGNIPAQEMEDYIGVAYEALCKAAKRYRNDRNMKFSSFADMTIKSSLKTHLTYTNRFKRVVNKLAKSLDEPVDDIEKLFLKDIIVGCEDVDIYEQSERIMTYLKKLSRKEKHVLYFLWRGESCMYIKDKLGYSQSEMKEILSSLRDHDKTKILRRSERNVAVNE